MSIDRSFLGTGWAFPPEFNKKAGDVKLVSEEDDIRESLSILLATSPGERIMQPSYGCGFRSMIFELISEGSVTELKDSVERAVLFFEPRVKLNAVKVDTERVCDGVLEIILDYTVRATNSRSNMVYPFYFKEGTNIRL